MFWVRERMRRTKHTNECIWKNGSYKKRYQECGQRVISRYRRNTMKRVQTKSFPIRRENTYLVEEFEDEREVALGVCNLEQRHDVGVLQLLQDGDLADGRGGRALIDRVEADLLERHYAVRSLVAALVDDAISALAELAEVRVTG